MNCREWSTQASETKPLSNARILLYSEHAGARFSASSAKNELRIRSKCQQSVCCCRSADAKGAIRQAEKSHIHKAHVILATLSISRKRAAVFPRRTASRSRFAESTKAHGDFPIHQSTLATIFHFSLRPNVIDS